MNLGDYVKYTDDDGNELLAQIQAKLTDGQLVISLAGGTTIKVDSGDVDADLSC